MINDTQAVLWEAMFSIADQKNWLQNGAQRGRKQCALMAILNAAAVPDKRWVAISIFRKIVGNEIISYNDAPGRTHAEVMEAFAKAIYLAGLK